MAHHLLSRHLPAQILLATSSLSRDIELGYHTPTSDTIGLVLEGIRLLKEQIQRPDGVSEDSILAVINLWIYEVTLTMDVAETGSENMATQEQLLSKSLTSNIQTHIDGLQRSILCLGGVRNLSPETSWLLAW